MREFHDVKVGLDEELEEHIQWLLPGFSSYRIIRQSVDARARHKPHFVYSVQVYEAGENPVEQKFEVPKVAFDGLPPIIIGAGPGGLFAALRFVERGIPSLLFEQGSDSTTRMKGISRFWRYGELNPTNNVCFGEGGAGLYSDGKLITRIKSPYIPYVMNRLVQFGAPAEIEYLANPHVGSDRIRRVIPKLRDYILANGGKIFFDSKVTELLTRDKQITGIKLQNGQVYHSNHVLLATGHSAEDMFHHLDELGVHIEGKSFAVGLRIEHPQEVVDRIQYRDAYGHPKLGAANYKLAEHFKASDVGVYSFCMCPGGYVLSSGTEANGVVCNGMSNFNRNSPYANAAIVASIDHRKSFGADKWGGLKFQKNLEQMAFQMVQQSGGTKELPAQPLLQFLERQNPTQAHSTSSPSGAKAAPLHELFSDEIFKFLREGILAFDKNMRGFIDPRAQVYGVESRTSSPIRITRNPDTLQSLSHKGLYPCGEGAGYAGGITSAACDGVRIAEKILG